MIDKDVLHVTCLFWALYIILDTRDQKSSRNLLLLLDNMAQMINLNWYLSPNFKKERGKKGYKCAALWSFYVIRWRATVSEYSVWRCVRIGWECLSGCVCSLLTATERVSLRVLWFDAQEDNLGRRTCACAFWICDGTCSSWAGTWCLLSHFTTTVCSSLCDYAGSLFRWYISTC